MTVTIFFGVVAVVMQVLNFVFSFLYEKNHFETGGDRYIGTCTGSVILGLVSAFVFLFFGEIELDQDSALDFLAKCGLMLLYIFVDVVVGITATFWAGECCCRGLRSKS